MRTVLAIAIAVVVTIVGYVIIYPLLTLWDIARGNTSWLQTLFMGTVAPGLGAAVGYLAADKIVKGFDRRSVAIGYSLVVVLSGVIVALGALSVTASRQYEMFDFVALGLSHVGAIAGLLIMQKQVHAQPAPPVK